MAFSAPLRLRHSITIETVSCVIADHTVDVCCYGNSHLNSCPHVLYFSCCVCKDLLLNDPFSIHFNRN